MIPSHESYETEARLEALPTEAEGATGEDDLDPGPRRAREPFPGCGPPTRSRVVAAVRSKSRCPVFLANDLSGYLF